MTVEWESPDSPPLPRNAPLSPHSCAATFSRVRATLPSSRFLPIFFLSFPSRHLLAVFLSSCFPIHRIDSTRSLSSSLQWALACRPKFSRPIIHSLGGFS